MNRLYNRFMIEFPKNSVFGWGARVNNIDLMKVIASSHHQRRFSIFDRDYPYVVKLKYLDLEYGSGQYYTVNGNPSIFNTPFSKPKVNVFDDAEHYEKNYVVISRRFKSESDCHQFTKNMKLHIDIIGNRVEESISNYHIN